MPIIKKINLLRPKRSTIAFLLGVVIFYSLFALVYQKRVLKTFSTQQEEPLITGFQFTNYDQEDKVFTITAKKFHILERSSEYFGLRLKAHKSAELEDVGVTFFKGGLAVSRLNSRQASMDIQKKNIVFSGAPVILTEDKKFLSATTIIWDDAQKKLFAQGKCFLSFEGKKYYAKRIDADAGIDYFSIPQH